MITATKLNRSYGDTIAISDVNFQIKSGEIVGLLGHNGAGKTTIMKMLTGFLEPTSGEIDIDGLSMIDEPLEAQKRIGYLPENCPVWPDMSVVEYLEFNLGLRGIARKVSAELIKSAINRLSNFFLENEAEKIFYPIEGSTGIRNLKESNEVSENLNVKKLHLVSVHGMSSLRSGKEENCHTYYSGKLKNYENIFINDASILPGNTGESPQASIMVMVKNNIKNLKL